MLHNLGLVRSIAQKHSADGMDYEDIVHQGVLGLIRAVQKFDASRGYKFSTYATLWIRQAIQRAFANEARLIRIPVLMLERVNKVERTRSRLMTLYGKCTTKEIADATELSIDQVVECLRLNMGIVSLDMTVGDKDGGGVLADFVAEDCERLTDPAALFDQRATISIIECTLDMLPERQATILRLRAGMDGDPKTLEQIGEIYGLTRERIRQLELHGRESLRLLFEEHDVK